MMAIAAGLGPLQEIYSIDESFIGDLDGITDLTRRAHAVRERILRWTSIPTCIGLAPTKTLASFSTTLRKMRSASLSYSNRCSASGRLAA